MTSEGMALIVTIPLWLQQAIEIHGYWIVLLAVAIESMGVPFPGETALLFGAVFAGTTGHLNIVGVIAAAATGAILGDNLGYTIGHFGGYPLVRRVARFLRIDQSRLDYAQRYFEKHGDKTVFLGRFFSVLRTWVAFLAGVNRMPWRSFFFWNSAGGITWATIYGILGYILGDNLPLLAKVLRGLGIAGIALLAILLVSVITLWLVRHRRQRKIVGGSWHPENSSAPPKDSGHTEAQPKDTAPSGERDPDSVA